MVNVSEYSNATANPELILNPEHTSGAAVIFLTLFTLITVLANLTVMLSFIIEPKIRKPFNYLLLSLTVSDFISGSLSMPHFILYTRDGYWPLGFNHCTFWLYIDWVSVTVSINMIAAISFDRMWAVFHPSSYFKFNTMKKTLIIVTSVWLVVHAAILPGQIYDRQTGRARYDPHECYWDFAGPVLWASPLFVVPITEWIPSISITICYILTLRKICTLSRERSRIVPRRTKVPGWVREQRWKNERQAFVLLTLLIVTFLVCWGPWFIYSGLAIFQGFDNATAVTVTYWLGYGMAMVNPFLFNFANPEIRLAVKRILWVGRGPVGPASRSDGRSWTLSSSQQRQTSFVLCDSSNVCSDGVKKRKTDMSPSIK